MAVDFTTPTKTQNYDTGVLQSIRANQVAIASFLDGQTITGNTAGLKRYNASSTLFERSDGTNWSEMPLGYLKLGGGTLTGALQLSGDATANLQPTTLQQVTAALGGKASTSALAGYALLASNPNFTGSITAGGNIAATGNVTAGAGLYAGSNVSAGGNVAASDGVLTTPGQFFMTAYGTALPTIQWDSGDSTRFDRGANQHQLWVGNAIIFKADATGHTLYNKLTWSSATTGSGNYSADFFMVNQKTGGGPSMRINPGNALELINSAYNAINFTFNDNGNFGASGLLYGRGGGAGLGQITVQSGGSPSGGAAGDLFLIY